MKRILVVAEHSEIGLLIALELGEIGYSVDLAHTLDKARELVGRHPYDILAVDLRLCELTGQRHEGGALQSPLLHVVETTRADSPDPSSSPTARENRPSMGDVLERLLGLAPASPRRGGRGGGRCRPRETRTCRNWPSRSRP